MCSCVRRRESIRRSSTAPSPGRAPAWTPYPSGGYVTANIYTDQTPKETYPYFFVTNIGLTTLGCVLTVALYMLFGLV